MILVPCLINGDALRTAISSLMLFSILQTFVSHDSLPVNKSRWFTLQQFLRIPEILLTLWTLDYVQQ